MIDQTENKGNECQNRFRFVFGEKNQSIVLSQSIENNEEILLLMIKEEKKDVVLIDHWEELLSLRSDRKQKE